MPGSEPSTVRITVPAESYGAPVGAHIGTARSSEPRRGDRVLEVAGIPFRDLAAGRRLVKIDAEGIEVDLLRSARAELDASRPVLVIEVLADADRLAAELRDIALAWNAPLHVVPAYGSDEVVEVPAASFDAGVPAQHRSKDIILGSVPPEVLLR